MDFAGGFERDVTLADGSVLRVRPVHAEDREQLAQLHEEGLSDTSAYFRFFGIRPHLTATFLDHMTEFEPARRASVVGLRNDRVVAIGTYDRELDAHGSPVPIAEVAFAVADEFQGLGIGTILMEDLAVIARAAGFRQLVAHVMADNRAMINVFAQVGLGTRRHLDDGVVDVEMDLSDDAGMMTRSDEREWAAQAASMRPFLAPRSVVVIGAGRDPSSPGHRIAANVRAGFGGDLAVVRPDAHGVAGVAGYATVGDVPFPIDLAVIAVPAAVAPDVLEQCGRAGVRAVVVITAGFSERGDGGIRDADLVAIAHRHGMRLLGPNCLGVIAPAVGLDATFAAIGAPAGGVAFGSQSGGLGVAVLAEAAGRGVGISSFVSLGNRADVSSNDLLCAWAEDDTTRVILLYLESIGNARRFLRIARHVSRTKPIVILKAGRTRAGRRGTVSHTAALASDDAAVDALFEAAGVLRVQTLQEMLDVVQLLDQQHAPVGRRVGLIGNAGGPLILAADASEARGLVVPAFSADLRERIELVVPTAASSANPVDLLATVTPDEVGDVVRIVAASGEVDSIVVASVAIGDRDADALGAALDLAPIPVPVAVSLSGVHEAPGGRAVFRYSELAVDAMAMAANWHTRRQGAAHTAADAAVAAEVGGDDGVDWVALRRTVRADAAVTDGGWLPPAAVARLLDRAAIRTVAAGVAASPAEAASLADRLASSGSAVVMKAVVPGLLHKTEAGGVVLGVVGGAAAAAIYADFQARFADLAGALVQVQVPPGPELLVGGRQDPVAGPLVVVAAGGIEAELLADRVVRAAPFSIAVAEELLLALRTSPRLTRFRGQPPVDLGALAVLVARVARLVAVVPEVVEFEINPVVAGTEGAVALDTRVRVDPDAGVPVPLRGN